MELTAVLAEIQNINNWEEPYFDWRKAYVASLFAKIAYLHIPQYELKNVDRTNLIPCAEYREIVKGSGNPGAEQILMNSEFGEFFIVETPYVVAVVIKINKVVFISLRGTQYLYDWLVNLNTSKSSIYGHREYDVYFHKGFHRAVSSCMYEIYTGVFRHFGPNNTIYVTGHSLGGALAAILHALWCPVHHHYLDFEDTDTFKKELHTHACYTFGMPRYGNFHAVQNYANPFHIYNQADIVPRVPPKFIGFEDSHIEYCLTSEGILNGTHIKGNSFSKFIMSLATLKGIREHDMELYISRTRQVRDDVS